MFVVSSTYTRPPTDAALLGEHRAFLGRCYDEGLFVASGPRPEFVGGAVIARGNDEDELRAIMERDPFVREGVVAEYELLQFHSSRSIHDDLVDS